MSSLITLDDLKLFNRDLASGKSSSDEVLILEFSERILVKLGLELLEDIGEF